MQIKHIPLVLWNRTLHSFKTFNPFNDDNVEEREESHQKTFDIICDFHFSGLNKPRRSNKYYFKAISRLISPMVCVLFIFTPSFLLPFHFKSQKHSLWETQHTTTDKRFIYIVYDTGFKASFLASNPINIDFVPI